MDTDFNNSAPCYTDLWNGTTLYKIRFECSFLQINLTSCLPAQSPEDVDAIAAICRATDIIWDVGFWFALVAGLLGNGLAIFTIASLPKSTSTFYVGLLAVSDIFALCIRGTIIVLSENGKIGFAANYTKLVAMLFDYCASYSNWLLVLIGLERFLTVRFPLQKRSILTLRRAQLSAVALALALLLAYGVTLSTMDYLDSGTFGVTNMLYAVLPLGLNSIIIVLISCQLRRVQRARKKILRGHTSSSPRSLLASTPSTKSVAASRQNSVGMLAPGTPGSHAVASPYRSPTTLQGIAHLENSITVMMLVAAVCFCLLTMPYCAVLYAYEYALYALRDAPVGRARWNLLYKTARLLTFLNLSVNFILYFLSAKKFRSQLYRVLTPRSWSFRSGHVNWAGYTANCNNNNSQNNSGSVFRALQLYNRYSDSGGETVHLRRYVKAKTSNATADAAAPAATSTAAAAAAADVSPNTDSVDVAVAVSVTVCDEALSPSDESHNSADQRDIHSDVSRTDSNSDEMGPFPTLARNSIRPPQRIDQNGQRNSICSSGSLTTGSTILRDPGVGAAMVVELEGHSGTHL